MTELRKTRALRVSTWLIAISLALAPGMGQAADSLPEPNEGGNPSGLWSAVVAAGSGGPTPTGIEKQIGNVAEAKALQRSGVVVLDPGARTVLFNKDADRPLQPASSLKILTAAAALQALGPQSRLATVTRLDGDVLYLVGGGDATLSRKDDRDSDGTGPASVRRLARQTAVALGGQTSVRLVFDDSLFTGPALGPGWASGFPAAGVAAPVSALMMDQGRKSPKAAARVKDPALRTARAFSRFLKNQGVTVRSVERGKAPATARELSRVESDTITTMVQRMLTASDNDVAECLGHLIGGAVSGDASFVGGAEGTTQVLREAGIDVAGLDLFDASGLSPENRVAPVTIGEVLSTVVREERWSAISGGLAVAGVTGTLATRFTTDAASAGRGIVRAKTGTLTGVGALAGTLVDRTGYPLVFVVIGNEIRSQARARNAMDRLASSLTECGCR